MKGHVVGEKVQYALACYCAAQRKTWLHNCCPLGRAGVQGCQTHGSTGCRQLSPRREAGAGWLRSETRFLPTPCMQRRDDKDPRAIKSSLSPSASKACGQLVLCGHGAHGLGRRRVSPSTHASSSKQCAADKIHQLLMIIPPQKCLPWLWMLTCQGNSPAWAPRPPMTLIVVATGGLKAGLRPQSTNKTQGALCTELHSSLDRPERTGDPVYAHTNSVYLGGLQWSYC